MNTAACHTIEQPGFHDWAAEALGAWELALEKETAHQLADARSSFRHFQILLEDSIHFARSHEPAEELDNALWEFFRGNYKPLTAVLGKYIGQAAVEAAKQRIGEHP